MTGWGKITWNYKQLKWRKICPGKKDSRNFGNVDLVFAGHQLEVDAALDLLRECYAKSVPLRDVIAEAKNYLNTKTTNTIHVQDQLNEIEKRYGPWL